ncbi:hypothetical protein [Chitinibacter sp. ZOR0017]|uniref:NMCC_0638 family (lipo)protein n=1 Tax=Chitinibacter sp. ZOR0017 TaxID=1339254 RepID=UPI000648F0C6|nr:hypothetical protein [Chitinibacter sp. ZOR0017]
MKLQLIIALLALTHNVFATEKPSAIQADIAFRIFSMTCIEHAGNHDKIKSWAAGKLQIANPEFSKQVLKERTGVVYGASNRIGEYLLVLTEPNQCSVWARKADAEQIENTLAKLANALQKANSALKVAKTTEQDSIDHKGQPFHQVGYTLSSAADPFTVHLLATTSKIENADMQAILTYSKHPVQ